MTYNDTGIGIIDNNLEKTIWEVFVAVLLSSFNMI